MMSMSRVLSVLFLVVLTSLFFFPFEFSFLPGINTKMFLAGCGLVLLFIRLAKGRRGGIDKDFFVISIFALGVSVVSVVSMVYNSTTDGSYMGYIVSMWVWTSAAYVVIKAIKYVHGTVSVEKMCFYLIAVGVCQCAIAVLIENIPVFKNFVNGFLAGEGYMGVTKRMHGIGCALDVGGGRLGAILIMIAYMLPKMHNYANSKIKIIILLVSYIFIAVVGNMIGRTATVGLILSLLYIFYSLAFERDFRGEDKKSFVKIFVSSLLISIVAITTIYNTNVQWRKNIRFGFEGFFSLAEKGEWDVQSNDMLISGYVFPDNTKTWIIGDGYMGNPENDPYYIGPESWGYYMNTDAGYCRFLFYFGLVGLGVFTLFFCKVCQVCMARFKNYQLMFLMFLILNLLIWIKVSTDIYLVFAPFLCISLAENEESEIEL